MPYGAGYSYTNMLNEEETDLLLRTYRPDVIVTGDQHEFCHYSRSNGAEDVR